MTTDSQTTSSLPDWWDTVSFNGKENFYLRENGELVLRQTHFWEERVITTLNPESAEMTLKALIEKFPEVEAKMKELETEWSAAEDKQKMIGKVERMKEYLRHTSAAGDFRAFVQPLQEMEATIKAMEEENYATRLKLVQEAEALADSEAWKETAQKLKDIGDQWKQAGHVDKTRSDELWNRLEAAKNKFFERKRQNQEDVEKELLQNLDLKLELVEKAENLAASEEWKNTTEVFRQLMDEWKKIGRTMHDKNEELWNRFINSKNTFYDRKKVHFETIQQEQEENMRLKEQLIEKAEELKDSQEWNATSHAYAALMDEWKSIGKVPIEKSEELWNRFNVAKEHFFQAKRQHFEGVKVSLEDNYAQKMALLKRAEVLQHSRQWREATEEINELMTEWKKIGPVPREHSNEIWEQFISARKKFFARKDEDRERRMQHAEKQKSSRLQQMHNFLSKLEDELKEEQEKLEDFSNGLNNITPGLKEEELRAHLQKLIAQAEHKIKHKEEKLRDVAKQLEELEQKFSGKNSSNKENHEES